MKFCIEFVGGSHPHSMRLMGEDPRTEQLIEKMELCFCNYSPDRNMDIYAITPEQAIDFINRYFGKESFNGKGMARSGQVFET